jgi:hypothetical protein
LVDITKVNFSDIINTILYIVYCMAGKKANEPRVQMRVPISFRDAVLKEAHAAGFDATTYLEGKRVVPA